MYSLHRLIQRLARHPTLQRSTLLRAFFESTEWVNSVLLRISSRVTDRSTARSYASTCSPPSGARTQPQRDGQYFRYPSQRLLAHPQARRAVHGDARERRQVRGGPGALRPPVDARAQPHERCVHICRMVVRASEAEARWRI